MKNPGQTVKNWSVCPTARTGGALPALLNAAMRQILSATGNTPGTDLGVAARTIMLPADAAFKPVVLVKILGYFNKRGGQIDPHDWRQTSRFTRRTPVLAAARVGAKPSEGLHTAEKHRVIDGASQAVAARAAADAPPDGL